MVQPFLGSLKLEGGRSKEGRDDKGAVCKVWKKGCNRKESAGTRKEKDPMPRI